MEEVKESLIEFTKTPKTFSYRGQTYSFCISLGYAEYPNNAIERSQLMRCADTALYEVKLHGKMDARLIRKVFNLVFVNN